MAGENVIYVGGGMFWGHTSKKNTYDTLAGWKLAVSGWGDETNPLKAGGSRVANMRWNPLTGLKR